MSDGRMECFRIPAKNQALHPRIQHVAHIEFTERRAGDSRTREQVLVDVYATYFGFDRGRVDIATGDIILERIRP
jgi:hypothetical protein